MGCFVDWQSFRFCYENNSAYWTVLFFHLHLLCSFGVFLIDTLSVCLYLSLSVYLSFSLTIKQTNALFFPISFEKDRSFWWFSNSRILLFNSQTFRCRRFFSSFHYCLKVFCRKIGRFDEYIIIGFCY